MALEPEVRRGGGLPFGQVASLWVCDPRYSTNLRTLYTILVTYADTSARDTSRGKPYRRELANQLGCSLKTLDRTLDEGEVAGLLTVEGRKDPHNPTINDANVYVLHDAELWNGRWRDPLPPGASAAKAAEELVRKRVEAKKAAGILPQGGRKKGSAAEVASPVTPPMENEGGVTGDARGSDTDDATGGDMGDATPSVTGDPGVASPVTPNIHIPVHTPDPQAPNDSARLRAADARRATGASRGSATSGKAASNGARAPRRLTRVQRDQVKAVISRLPRELQMLMPDGVPDNLALLVLTVLEDRTDDQIISRIERRWNLHGYAEAAGASEVRSPVGVAMALIRPTQCPDPRCEDGSNVDTGKLCPRCHDRREDHRARQRGQQVLTGAAGDPESVTDVRPRPIPGPRATNADGGKGGAVTPLPDSQTAPDDRSSITGLSMIHLAMEAIKAGTPMREDDPRFDEVQRESAETLAS